MSGLEVVESISISTTLRTWPIASRLAPCTWGEQRRV